MTAAIAGSLFKMADFTRSVAWRFWFALLILCDTLMHLVRAATLEDRSEYQVLDCGRAVPLYPYLEGSGAGGRWCAPQLPVAVTHLGERRGSSVGVVN